MWIVFIALGVICILIGLVLLVTAQQTQGKTPQHSPTSTAPGHPKIEAAPSPNYDALLQTIELAMADGHISKNERIHIHEKAKDLNISTAETEKLILVTETNFDGQQEVKPIDVNKEAGDLFETFIAQKVQRNKLMTLTAWQGDKNIGTGVELECTKHPDLQVTWQYNDLQAQFAIECKYRSNLPADGFGLTPQKLQDYQQFEKEKNRPVFIALGLGDTANHPANLYLIPLAQLAQKQTLQALAPYKMDNPNGNLFFDYKNKNLRQTDKLKKR